MLYHLHKIESSWQTRAKETNILPPRAVSYALAPHRRATIATKSLPAITCGEIDLDYIHGSAYFVPRLNEYNNQPCVDALS